MTGMELREIRTRIGISQREMADCLGVPLSTFSRWERGVSRIIRAGMVRSAAEALEERVRAGEEAALEPAVRVPCRGSLVGLGDLRSEAAFCFEGYEEGEGGGWLRFVCPFCGAGHRGEVVIP